MDARLKEKYETRLKDGFLRNTDRQMALSERFEETVQELIESSGLKYQPQPEINNKKPDGVIHHHLGKTYIEAVCAQRPEELNDEKGEVDLCKAISPKLIDQNLRIHLSYQNSQNDESETDRERQATAFKNMLSQKHANSVFRQVQNMTSAPPDQYGVWTGQIEVRKHRLNVLISNHQGQPIPVHIGHSACAVGFIKTARRGRNAGDRYKADRKRVIRKIEKYKLTTLEGFPLIVAIYSQNAWSADQAAEIAYGTTYDQLNLQMDANSDRLLTRGSQNILVPDGIWSDRHGRQRMNLAATWIFHSFDTTEDLPFLAINPFLEDKDLDQAIPKRLRDISIICRPRPDGKMFT